MSESLDVDWIKFRTTRTSHENEYFGWGRTNQTKQSALKGASEQASHQDEHDRQKRLIYVKLLFCIKACHDRIMSFTH